MTATTPSASVTKLTDRLRMSTRQPTQKIQPESDLLAKITQELHRLLELGDLLELFIDRVRLLLPVDGLSYSHDDPAISLSTNIQGKHRVNYQLSCDQGKLGNLVFTRHRPFTTEEFSLLEVAISCLHYPLRNALQFFTAQQAANTDPLTQCGNRFSLVGALNREAHLAEREHTPLSIIMFDFDHFKKLNDRYGHQAGDEVLRQSCRQIKDKLRKTDLLFRYGGEEFLILLHNTDLAGATSIAERIRTTVQQNVTTHDQQSINTTVSLGVAAFHPNEQTNVLIERADQALYKAKKMGRNQVYQAS